MNDFIKQRREVIDTCKWLAAKGFVFGTWGNVSVRLEDGNLLITPTKLDYNLMQPEDLIVMSPSGEIIAGHRLPTSEREIHRGIMNRRKNVGAIIHMHSPFAMAACALSSGIPPISEEMCQLIGGEIPITDAFVPSADHAGLGTMVTDCIRDKNAVLIRNHGPVCCGGDLAEACLCCEVVEKSAMIYLHLQRYFRINVIAEEHVIAGRRYFTEAYGQS